MRGSLVARLCCPECRGSLRIEAFQPARDREGETPQEVEEGVLLCGCGAAYPVTEGIPRLLEGALHAAEPFRSRWGPRLRACGAVQAANPPAPSKDFLAAIEPTRSRFGLEWERHPLEVTTWGLDQATRLEHALGYLGWRREEAAGRMVLDAGCGTGKLTCGMATWGAEVVGLDLSPSLVKGWKAREALAPGQRDRIHMVQGSVLKPPFRMGLFDGIHSAGVLHHTPDTRAAFGALAALVKPGGTFGVWLYRTVEEGEGRVPWFPFVRASWASVSTDFLRRWTPGMPPRLLHGTLYAYSALFHCVYSVAARVRGRRHDQTIRERTTSLFDTLAPPFVWRHTQEEVAQWFLEEGFEAAVETTVKGDVDGFCMTGRRRTGGAGDSPSSPGIAGR